MSATASSPVERAPDAGASQLVRRSADQRSSAPRPARHARRHAGDLRVPGAIVLVALAAAACSSQTAASTSASAGHHGAGHHGAGHHGAGHHGANGLVGRVRSVSGSALVVEVRGTARTFALSPATTYRQGRHRVGRSALERGERVRVRLAPGSTAPTAEAVLVLPVSLSGVVSALGGQGFTLRTANGKTTAVRTSASTTYREGTTAVGASALKAGEKIRVLGQLGTSGAFSGTKVVVAPGS